MTCLHVRDRLPEYALGLLEGEELQRVERHLEWCAGCRKEARELLESVLTLALSLPEADPPPALEERVVRGVMGVAGRPGERRRRRGVRLLAVAALAAALAAVGAMGWGFAERRQVESYREQVRRTTSELSRLAAVARRVQAELQGTAKVFQVSLSPGPGQREAGSALIFAGPRGAGTVAVEVVGALDESKGPFRVELTDASGSRLLLGPLAKSNNGTHVLLQDVVQDLSRPESVELSRVVSLRVVDREGWPVLVGSLEPSAQATSGA